MEDDDLDEIYKDYYQPTFAYFDANRGDDPIMDIRWVEPDPATGKIDCGSDAMGGIEGYKPFGVMGD